MNEWLLQEDKVPSKRTGELSVKYESSHLWEFNRNNLIGFMNDLGYMCRVNIEDDRKSTGTHMTNLLFQKGNAVS